MADFKLQLSDFKFLPSRRGPGRMLRLSVTWELPLDDGRVLGESIEGCLAVRDSTGQLHFNPPVSRFGPNQSKQLITIREDYHNMIARKIRESKYNESIGNGLLAEFQAKHPADVDPDLPLIL